jgi:hypothetical protein
MFMFPNGAVFSVDADGYVMLSFGKPLKVDTARPAGLNDDGNPSTCLPLALAQLRLDQFRAFAGERLTHERLDELMAGFERVDWENTVGEFINAHRTGNFLVVSYDGHGTHAWALVDGAAHNITTRTLGKHVRRVWKIN